MSMRGNMGNVRPRPTRRSEDEVKLVSHPASRAGQCSRIHTCTLQTDLLTRDRFTPPHTTYRALNSQAVLRGAYCS